MTNQPVTIDLGVISHTSRAEAPHLAESRRHWTAGRSHLWWPAALLSAALVLAAAGAVPLRPWATSHLTVPAGSRFALDPDTLYAIDPPAADTERTLTAYRLADGAVRWRIGWPAAAPPVVWEDLVLLSRPRTHARDGTVTAIDPGTGRPMWTRNGSLVGRAGDRLVLRAGDRLHSYHAPSGARTASLPVGAGRVPRQVVGDLLLMWGRGSVIHAYDLAGLTRRWSTGVAGRRRGAVLACGRLLCLSGGDRVLALDPATGRPEWWTGFPAAGGPGRVDLVAGGPEWGDRIVLRASPSVSGRSWLVDARSGTPITELPGWRPVRRPPAAAPETGALLTRYLNRTTWFAQVRPGAPGIAVLGALDGGPQRGCRRAETYLACYSRQAVRVWRLRLPWAG